MFTDSLALLKTYMRSEIPVCVGISPRRPIFPRKSTTTTKNPFEFVHINNSLDFGRTFEPIGGLLHSSLSLFNSYVTAAQPHNRNYVAFSLVQSSFHVHPDVSIGISELQTRDVCIFYLNILRLMYAKCIFYLTICRNIEMKWDFMHSSAHAATESSISRT